MNASMIPSNNLGPVPAGQMSSVIALVTGLIKTVPNEEFGVLMQWMNEEGNRRRDHVRGLLSVGTDVVWVNTTKKLTQGKVVEIGAKNAKVRSQHGGELFVPLSRLELASAAAARMSSLPPATPQTAIRPAQPPAPSTPAQGPSVSKARQRKAVKAG